MHPASPRSFLHKRAFIGRVWDIIGSGTYFWTIDPWHITPWNGSNKSLPVWHINDISKWNLIVNVRNELWLWTVIVFFLNLIDWVGAAVAQTTVHVSSSPYLIQVVFKQIVVIQAGVAPPWIFTLWWVETFKTVHTLLGGNMWGWIIC